MKVGCSERAGRGDLTGIVWTECGAIGAGVVAVAPLMIVVALRCGESSPAGAVTTALELAAGFAAGEREVVARPGAAGETGA